MERCIQCQPSAFAVLQLTFSIISPPGIAMPPAGLRLMLRSFLMSPLSFDNGWTDRNVNSVDENISLAKNLVNFDPVTCKILWFFCMCRDFREANIRTVLVKGHPLGGSSIASLYMSKKCTVAQCACRAGYTLGSALISSLLN